MTESNKHLLQSSLSGANIRLYRSICEELGQSLEAVTPETLQSSPSDQESSTEEVREKSSGLLLVLMRSKQSPRGDERGTVSFTAQIRDLESANRDLGIELDRTRSRLEESLSESRRLKSETARLQNQLQASGSRARDFNVELDRVRAKVTEAMQVLSRGGGELDQQKAVV